MLVLVVMILLVYWMFLNLVRALQPYMADSPTLLQVTSIIYIIVILLLLLFTPLLIIKKRIAELTL